MRKTLQVSCLVAAVAAAACGGGRTTHDQTATPVRVAPPEAVVSCAEWVERATADPEIAVERVPEPVKLDPAPFPKRFPRGVIGKDGKAEVRIRVVVDTLGTANMRTFAVVKSTHPTLTRSVQAAVAKWKFVPAQVSGCKVPRNFNGVWVAGGASGDGAAPPR